MVCDQRKRSQKTHFQRTHNPEVEGSNPSPATTEAAGQSVIGRPRDTEAAQTLAPAPRTADAQRRPRRFKSLDHGPRRSRIAEPSSAGSRVTAGAIPVQPTPFVGSEHELYAVCSALGAPDVRLLMITGPRGSGRPSSPSGRRTDPGRIRGGTFFVPMAANRDAVIDLTDLDGMFRTRLEPSPELGARGRETSEPGPLPNSALLDLTRLL